MSTDTKLAILDRIYAIYDDFAGKLNRACQKHCTGCCTRNVTLTTLEGYQIAAFLVASGPANVFEKLQTAAHQKRFQPQATINGLAELCMQGTDCPDEAGDPAWGPCPFLFDNECPFYTVRPFGCRCMVSKHICLETGYADMDPLTLTVNNICLQYIEHVDARGYSGNLTDVLTFMASHKNRFDYKTNNLLTPPADLIANRPVKVLMIPPEHWPEVKPILNALNRIQVPMK
jgi:hypothetical protein